jgi:hypothetical protein
MTLDSVSEMNSDFDFMTSAERNVVWTGKEVQVLDSRLEKRVMNQFQTFTTSKGLNFTAIKLEEESSTVVTVEIGWDFRVGRG